MSVCVCPLVDFWPIQGSSRPPCHRLSMKRVKKMEWMDGISMCTHVCLCVFSLGLGLRQRPRGCESLQLITESSSQRGGALLSPPTSWFIPQDAWLWIVTLRSSGRADPLCPLCSRPAPSFLFAREALQQYHTDFDLVWVLLLSSGPHADSALLLVHPHLWKVSISLFPTEWTDKWARGPGRREIRHC